MSNHQPEHKEGTASDLLKEQLARMKSNKLKNANQICDQIYYRSLERIKKAYRIEVKKKALGIKEKSSIE